MNILPLKSVIPNFVACLVFFGMTFSFIKLISSSDTLAKRKAAILKICPPAIVTSAEVIIAEYDAILGQWERENFYNHLSNYTKASYYMALSHKDWELPNSWIWLAETDIDLFNSAQFYKTYR